MEHLFFECG
jgi:hypothetical protein